MEKLNSFTHEAIFQPPISPDLRGTQGDNLSCSMDEGEKLSSLNNDDDSLDKQINFRLNTSASNNDLENPCSTQKFKGVVKDCCDNTINNNNNFKDAVEDEINASEDVNCFLVTNNDDSAKECANDKINNEFVESQNNLINTDNDLIEFDLRSLMTENDTIDFKFFEKQNIRFNSIEESDLALKGFLQ